MDGYIASAKSCILCDAILTVITQCELNKNN